MTMAQQAQSLYTGQLFQKSKAYAQQLVEEGEADAWYILSAKHGLLEPTDTVEPYDATLTGASEEQKHEWARQVTNAIALHADTERPGDRTYLVLGGRDYYEPIQDFYDSAPESERPDIITPFEGMAGNGEMMQWLGNRTDEDVYTEPSTHEFVDEPRGDGAPSSETSADDIGTKRGDIEMTIAACDDAGLDWTLGTEPDGAYFAQVQDGGQLYEISGEDTPAGALFDAYMKTRETGDIGQVVPGQVDVLLSAEGEEMWDEEAAELASIPSLLVAHRVAGARQETWRTELITEEVRRRAGTVTEEDIPEEAMKEVRAEVGKRLQTAAA